MSFKEPNSKLVRWALKLKEYDYIIEYKPGRINNNADALSRIPLEVNLNEIDRISTDATIDSEENISPDSTVHSAESDTTDLIPILESCLNQFKHQFMFKRR